jgi:hypothetical protein
MQVMCGMTHVNYSPGKLLCTLKKKFFGWQSSDSHGFSDDKNFTVEYFQFGKHSDNDHVLYIDSKELFFCME